MWHAEMYLLKFIYDSNFIKTLLDIIHIVSVRTPHAIRPTKE